MRCPFCSAKDTKVMDSRSLKEGLSIRRRRRCEHCTRRFTTYETIEVTMPQVVKQDGRREAYERAKAKSGIMKACQKRPISIEQIERVLDNIEKSLLEISQKEISSEIIGNKICMYLRNLDPVAYIRFASVYREFQDVDEFVNNIKDNELNFITKK